MLTGFMNISGDSCLEKLEIEKGESENVNRRSTGKIITKMPRTKTKVMTYKTPHRKLMI